MEAVKNRFVLKRHPMETERARNLVAECCADLVSQVSLTAQLLVSELFDDLVENGSGLVTLTVWRTPDELRAELTDHPEDDEVPRQAAPVEGPARGLLIVEALAHAWGVQSAPGEARTVWFSLTVPR